MHTKLVKAGQLSFRIVVAMVLIPALSGCSVPGLSDSDLSERLEQNGYSFMPPSETGWFIASRTSNRIALAKVGKVEGQTYLIEGDHLALDRLTDPSRLTDFAQRRDERNLPPPRFRVRDYSISQLDIGGAQCALSKIVAEDRDPETGTNVVTAMLIETVGTVCIHPMNPALGITMTLSHRSFPEDQDRAFGSYGQSLLQTQQFSPLNQ